MNLTVRTQTGLNGILTKNAMTMQEASQKLEGGYGQRPWERIEACPNPYENTIIARAQSILTMDGHLGPVLPFQWAMDVVNWYKPQL